MIVADSSIVIDVLRGHVGALRWLSALDEVPTCSEVSRVEVLQGMRSGERSRTERFLQTLRWAPVDEPVSRRAGELGRDYRASQQGVGVADLIVAATALVLGGELATRNVRHFPMFDALAVPYPG